ncbi:MAG TPA: BatD family protein [Kofleriaceae bacterium]|nr:BatD family protein [Kofleriaceae bacterium]
MKRLAIGILVLLGLAGIASAEEPRAELRLESQPHAGVPFNIAMVIAGFDEQPQPQQPKLDIPGARVTPLGGEPSVSQSIQIINGKRSDFKRVTWTLRWRVELDKAGRVRVPAVTVVQGSKRVTTQAGDLDAEAVPTTDDMKIELALPDRTVFVGETIEATLIWRFRTEPESQTFSVPLMSMDEFIISAPPATDPRRALSLPAGSKELKLPYDVADDGAFKKVTVRFYVAPKKPGKLEVPGPTVVAALAVGRRDFFGNAPTRMFRTSGAAKTLEVKPLPETDKPPGFAGAVGSQFSIAVATSRSVVQLGEPVELTITVKSNQRLDTLSLGHLDAPGGLPKDKFTVPAEAPTGELADDGLSKTFKVTAQVTGPATEIPAIAFSYFDPVKGHYQTIHSDPIAVSVKGGSIVGAGDVVAMSPKHGSHAANLPEADLALVGADLALSAPGVVDSRPLGGALLWLLIAGLYAIPLALFGVRSWQLRTQTQREEAAEVKAARKKVEHELARAAKDPARDTAGPLVAALRAFARVLAIPEREPRDSVLADIEHAGYAPSSATSPLSAELRTRAEDLMKRWTAETKHKRSPNATAAAVLLAIVLAPAASHASPLDDGRTAYQQAMTLTDASARKAAFTRAAAALGDAARTTPDRPELLTDWGNAALGAGDVATATLAYRRALALDGGNARARRNLAWLRSKLPDTMRPAEGSATDSLFFFHHWPRSSRLLVGAVAFGIAILLLVPWAGRRRRALTGISVLPFAVWLAMLLSLVLEDRHADDAIVMDGVVLRAADSAGAPAALTQPLPRGAEVRLVERRDTWTKIQLASGTTGWVPDGAVQRISR